jgi:acetolactate synthase-1/2/3 large subunit
MSMIAIEDVSGGRLLTEALVRQGVDRVFSVSGGPINPVYVACADGNPQLHHVRSEAAAAFMADAVYRATGRAGVAVVTLGPGVTNTVTACATASLAGVPMLVVGTQVGAQVIDKGAGMAIDTLPVMRPVTKWAASVPSAARIPEYVAEAWRRMHAPTPGPVYLEIPSDVMADELAREEADRLLGLWRPLPPAQATAPDPATLDRAADLLRASRKTLVLVGDDCFHSSDRPQVEWFLQWARAAFAPLRLARGLVDDAAPRSIGPGYVPCNPVLVRALDEADTVVLLGHHWEFDLEFGAGVGAETTVLQVIGDASRVGRNGRVDVPVIASVGGFISGLRALVDAEEPDAAPPQDGDWAHDLAGQWRAGRAEAARAAASGADEALHPVTLVEAVAAAAPAGTTFVTSHGNIDFWADEVLSVDGRGHYLRAGQSGSLGAEVPFGVSAALTQGGPVVVFVGDGGIGYAISELDSAARYGADVLVVVADDEQWSAIALPQHAQYGVAVELGLPGRDWSAVAEALGARGRRAATEAEVGVAVKEILAAGGPGLLQVPIRAVESPYMAHISR